MPGKNFMDEDVLNTGIQMSVELTKKEAQLIALSKRFAVPPPAWSENPTEELKNAGVTPFQAELTVGRNSDGKYMMNVKSTGDYLSEIMSRPEFVSPLAPKPKKKTIKKMSLGFSGGLASPAGT